VESLSDSHRQQLALHEAAHAVCAWLYGRPLGAIRIGSNGGATEVGTLREDYKASLEDVVDELAILSIGAIVSRGFEGRLPREGDDDDRQRRVAQRACRTSDEIAALIAFGEARARSVASSAIFIEKVELLWPLLMERGELGGEELTDHLDGLKVSLNGSP
jgi:hypothetical protein